MAIDLRPLTNSSQCFVRYSNRLVLTGEQFYKPSNVHRVHRKNNHSFQKIVKERRKTPIIRSSKISDRTEIRIDDLALTITRARLKIRDTSNRQVNSLGGPTLSRVTPNKNSVREYSVFRPTKPYYDSGQNHPPSKTQKKSPRQPDDAPPLSSAQVGRIWAENAKTWVRGRDKGYDPYRKYVTTAQFLDLLLPIDRKCGLDVGCGHGDMTRRLAGLGAKMHGLDISSELIRYAKANKQLSNQSIKYVEGDALSLPYKKESFDFITAFFSLMDMPDYDRAIGEAYRVLKEGAFFQFGILHPCFDVTGKWVFDEHGEKAGFALSNYFDRPEETKFKLIFEGGPSEALNERNEFDSVIYQRSLSQWINTLIETGFVINRLVEPAPDKKTAEQYPQIAGSRMFPHFLFVRCSKSESPTTSTNSHKTVKPETSCQIVDAEKAEDVLTKR